MKLIFLVLKIFIFPHFFKDGLYILHAFRIALQVDLKKTCCLKHAFRASF